MSALQQSGSATCRFCHPAGKLLDGNYSGYIYQKIQFGDSHLAATRIKTNKTKSAKIHYFLDLTLAPVCQYDIVITIYHHPRVIQEFKPFVEPQNHR